MIYPETWFAVKDDTLYDENVYGFTDLYGYAPCSRNRPPPLHSLCVIRIASQASSPFRLATRLASCAKIPIDSLLNPLLLFLA